MIKNEQEQVACGFCGAEGKIFVVPHPAKPPKFWPYANHAGNCPLRPGEFYGSEAEAVERWNSRLQARPDASEGATLRCIVDADPGPASEQSLAHEMANMARQCLAALNPSPVQEEDHG